MTEYSRRKPEISRREKEKMRAETIRVEMASAVRLLGEHGRNADEQNHLAARRAGLSVTVIERLRWKKIGRIPADIADTVREALAAHTRNQEAKARHEARILAARLNGIAALADSSSDPDFYREHLAPVVEQAGRLGLLDSAVAEPDER